MVSKYFIDVSHWNAAILNIHSSRPMRHWLLITMATLFLAGMILPQSPIIPVMGASRSDWNPISFWHYPWGASGVHKGIDIFSPESTPVVAATSGLVIYVGQWRRGGNVILSLGPRWCIHYYAHLRSGDVSMGSWIWRGQKIGQVGNTGNAVNTPSHLHYSILTLVPYPWRLDRSESGWMKIFFLDPNILLP